MPRAMETTAAGKTCVGDKNRLQLAERKRDLALFNLAIDSKLRGCDVVSLRVGDIASTDGEIRPFFQQFT